MPYRKTYKRGMGDRVLDALLHPTEPMGVWSITLHLSVASKVCRSGAVRNSLSRLLADGRVTREWDDKRPHGRYVYRRKYGSNN